MRRRVLLLGPTGMDKKNVLKQLAQAGQDTWHRDSIWPVAFEQEYVNPIAGNHFTFLNSGLQEQSRIWSEAWDRFVRDLFNHPNEDVILSMHGAFVWQYYGVRVVTNSRRIVDDFAPNVVITLLDDVYDMWWRTQDRSRGNAFQGEPSLEQLISARRMELMVGDLIALQAIGGVKHFAIGIGHSFQSILRLAFHDSPKVVYLAFPISSPRRMKAAGDNNGVREIDTFLKRVMEWQRNANGDSLVLVCPLVIDELPLRSVYLKARNSVLSAGDSEKTKQFFTGDIGFDRDREKWDLTSVWDDAASIAPAASIRKPIPVAQLEDAVGLMLTDVGWRDYRLVSQATCLFAFNPRYHSDEPARSVMSEIRTATRTSTPVYCYQDPTLDPEARVKNRFEPGTMGHDAGTLVVQIFDDLEYALSKAQEFLDG